MIETYDWIMKNWDNVVVIYLGIVGVASVIVKLTPTLHDDTVLLSIVKFIAKYMALNTNSPAPEDRPK